MSLHGNEPVFELIEESDDQTISSDDAEVHLDLEDDEEE